ncbi:MAG: hypothetical protein QM791_04100 [Ferruginibacter sp.]
MFNLTTKAKEILDAIKAKFNESAPAATAAPTTTPTTYKTKDDGKEISIAQAGETPAVGDVVTIDSAPAAAGDLTLEDGTVLTIGDEGAITVIVEPMPVTQPDLSTDKLPNTPEALRAMYAAFATGTPDERIANLELVCKAMMEYCFGWQIQEAETKQNRDAAINVYKTGMEAALKKNEAFEAKFKKQDEMLKGLLDLVEEMATVPQVAPKTLPENKREVFEAKKDEKIKKVAASIKAMKEKK